MESMNILRVLDENLNSVNKATRDKLAEVGKDDLFVPVFDISLRDAKDLAMHRLRKIMASKAVSVKDFLRDPDNIFTAHEMVNM